MHIKFFFFFQIVLWYKTFLKFSPDSRPIHFSQLQYHWLEKYLKPYLKSLRLKKKLSPSMGMHWKRSWIWKKRCPFMKPSCNSKKRSSPCNSRKLWFGFRIELASLSLVSQHLTYILCISYNMTICSCRFLGGLAYGGFSMVALAYIVELTDDELRGPLALLTAGNIVTGK